MEELNAHSAGERRRAGKERKARFHALSEQLNDAQQWKCAYRGRHRGSWDREVHGHMQRRAILTHENARVVDPAAPLKAEAAKPYVWRPSARLLAQVQLREAAVVEPKPYTRGCYISSPGCYTSAHAAEGCRALLEGLPSRSAPRIPKTKTRALSTYLFAQTSPAPAVPIPSKRPGRPGSKLCAKAPRIIMDEGCDEDALSDLEEQELLHVDPEDLPQIEPWPTSWPTAPLFPAAPCIPEEAPAEEEEQEEQEDAASDMSLELLDFVLIHMSDAEEEQEQKQEQGEEMPPAELPSAAVMDFSGPSSYDEGPGAATMLIERLGGLGASYHPLGQCQAEEEEAPRAAPAGPLMIDLGQLLELAARKPLTHKQRQKQLRRQAQHAARLEEAELVLHLEQIREMERELPAASEAEQAAAPSEAGEDEAELEFVLV